MCLYRSVRRCYMFSGDGKERTTPADHAVPRQHCNGTLVLVFDLAFNLSASVTALSLLLNAYHSTVW